MRLSPVRLAVAASLLALGVPVSATGAAERPLRLVRDVQAGTAAVDGPDLQANTTVEPHVAADPRDPRRAVAVYQVARATVGAGAIGVSATRDGGRSWRQSLLPRTTPATGGEYAHISDPVVAFGPDGEVHVSTLAIDFTGSPYRSAVLHHVSRDGGLTFTGPYPVFDDSLSPPTSPGAFNDKNWMTVDTGTGPGHHPGRVYVTWTRDVALATYSDDGGKTWALPAVVNGPVCAVTNPVVVANGDLAVSCWVFGGRPVRQDPGDTVAEPMATLSLQVSIARAADQPGAGAPLVFGPRVTVSSYLQGSPQEQRAGGTVSMAGDPRRPTLHLAWEDTRHDLGRTDLLVATSVDGGLTWEPPREVVVGDEPGSTERWAPMVAVGADGTLHLAYRSRDADELGEIDTYLVTDSGAGFGRPTRVNRVRTDLQYAATSAGRPFLGDYNGVAVSGRLTYVVRCEAFRPRARQDGPHQTTWVAVVERR